MSVRMFALSVHPTWTGRPLLQKCCRSRSATAIALSAHTHSGVRFKAGTQPHENAVGHSCHYIGTTTGKTPLGCVKEGCVALKDHVVALKSRDGQGSAPRDGTRPVRDLPRVSSRSLSIPV